MERNRFLKFTACKFHVHHTNILQLITQFFGKSCRQSHETIWIKAKKSFNVHFISTIKMNYFQYSTFINRMHNN
ncbi:hypothetical protein DERP_015261 [Dermatophagoides pteronyssinus]|uniref:Uncharacterized protein n=1 Tax=Dermatophagoides pteronyssinus TaxID=6956 RepID=A0ABQ8JKN2_DERPT|nr:hypothetical protein DERP_015261 [Dermatophagoides pteronyssinus]